MARTKQSSLQGAVWPLEPFFVATMPLPPSVNGSFKTNRNAQFYASDALRDFKELARYEVSRQRELYDWSVINAIKGSKQKIPLQWRLDIYFKTMWQRDATGPVKAAEDACFDYIGINDNCVVRFSGEKYADRDNPRFEMSISVCLDRMDK